MTANMNTVLIIGGTSGLGEGFARRFHGLGKKVIITGRRNDRLSTLAKDLPGLETYQWDVSDLSSLGSHASTLLEKYPAIDTVILMAGIMRHYSFFDASSSTDKAVTSEIDTNLTAPIILSRTLIPALSKRAAEGTKTNLIFVSSGLAYIPFGLYPVYCPTKAAIHTFCLTLRQQLNFAPEEIKKNLSICELAPPYVDTALDADFREDANKILGDHAPPPMALETYLDQAMQGLSEVENGKMKKEVPVPGFSELGVKTWRESFGEVMKGMGVDC